MEDVIHPPHGLRHAALVTHVSDIKLQLGVVVLLTHVVLLLLVTAENADLADIGGKEAFKDSVAEGTCTTGNQQAIICKLHFRTHRRVEVG